MLTAETRALLALLRLKGVGRRRALTALPHSLPRDVDAGAVWEKLTGTVEREAFETAWTAAGDEAARHGDAGISIIGFHDEAYPQRLWEIPDPPAVLYVLGEVASLGRERASVGVIGTREPTPFGAGAAFQIGKRAADAGMVVVSGLARGCDIEAHRGCLDRQGQGVVVLAHGLDRLYPREHQTIADALRAHGGCLVSEYPCGVEPARHRFIERDRLQSGLSHGVVVVEAGLRSGTMHTVGFALQQMRRIACVVHPESLQGHPQTQGNRRLLERAEAEGLNDRQDVLAFLRRVSRGSAPRPKPLVIR